MKQNPARALLSMRLCLVVLTSMLFSSCVPPPLATAATLPGTAASPTPPATSTETGQPGGSAADSTATPFQTVQADTTTTVTWTPTAAGMPTATLTPTALVGPTPTLPATPGRAPTATPAATLASQTSGIVDIPHVGGGGGKNMVHVTNRRDQQLTVNGSVQLNRIPGPSVAPANQALASASCTDCQTLAVALQINLISRAARRITPLNTAMAVNVRCTRCITVAVALQYVYSVDDPLQETPPEVPALIRAMDRELIAIGADRDLHLREAVARLDAVIARFQTLAESLDDRRDAATELTSPGPTPTAPVQATSAAVGTTPPPAGPVSPSATATPRGTPTASTAQPGAAPGATAPPGSGATVVPSETATLTSTPAMTSTPADTTVPPSATTTSALSAQPSTMGTPTETPQPNATVAQAESPQGDDMGTAPAATVAPATTSPTLLPLPDN